MFCFPAAPMAVVVPRQYARIQVLASHVDSDISAM